MNRRTNGNGNREAFFPEMTASIGRKLTILEEESFLRMIALERRRSERSRKPFVLMLLDLGTALPSTRNCTLLGKVLTSLGNVSRETDVAGWYKADRTIGIIFTELIGGVPQSIVSTIHTRIRGALHNSMRAEVINQFTVAIYLFPETKDSVVFTFPPIPSPDVHEQVPRIDAIGRPASTVL